MNSLSGVLDLLHMSQNIGTDCKNTGRLDYKIFLPMKEILSRNFWEKSTVKHFMQNVSFIPDFFLKNFGKNLLHRQKCFIIESPCIPHTLYSEVSASYRSKMFYNWILLTKFPSQAICFIFESQQNFMSRMDAYGSDWKYAVPERKVYGLFAKTIWCAKVYGPGESISHMIGMRKLCGPVADP